MTSKPYLSDLNPLERATPHNKQSYGTKHSNQQGVVSNFENSIRRPRQSDSTKSDLDKVLSNAIVLQDV
ncbi:hypothetical protein RhiXN_02416 [Rhizoctonia solani]|uniref:Uncharacterized protein n=1 Tax=Rhizoctonia solani TaxID=456999 RepID=A0A8H8NPG6_9AGAM|nr:uncharacterized protein RhiXN_02416 [Rhizoctonia solani]QRW17494.1 hypothetical protein RhiXN_02416 [Rhizoctonia solani]